MKQISNEGIRKQQSQVLKLVGKRPVTAGQLTVRAKGKLDRYQISRRLPELEEKGKVVRDGRCKCPVVGSWMWMWRCV